MTSKLTITDERVISVIERLEHYACNLKWTNVRGAQDLLTAADGLRELQERRKADSEPVAWIHSNNDIGIPAITVSQKIGHYWMAEFENVQPLYRHAQPAPETEREPIAWLNDAYLARGVVDGEAGSEDAGPGYIPVYREASPAQPAPVVPDERAAFNAWNNEDNLPIAGVSAKNAAWLAWQARAELAGNSPVIPDGLIAAVNRLLDSDGSRGCYSAIRCGDAHDEIERLLATAPQELQGE